MTSLGSFHPFVGPMGLSDALQEPLLLDLREPAFLIFGLAEDFAETFSAHVDSHLVSDQAVTGSD